MRPSNRLLRAAAAERAALERQRARLADEARDLRSALARIEAGMAEIDERRGLLDRLAPPEEVGEEAPAPGTREMAVGTGEPARTAREREAGAGEDAAGGGAVARRGREPAGGRDAASRGVEVAVGGGESARPARGGVVGGGESARPARGGVVGGGESARPAGEDSRTRGGGDAFASRARGGAAVLRGPAIREAAVRVLVRHGEDSRHYRDWFALLEDAGYEVAGKDPLAVFLTQLSRSPAVRKGPRAGVYELDRNAAKRLTRALANLHEELATLTKTHDLQTIRARRAQLTAEIDRTEKALEEIARTLAPPNAVATAAAMI